MKARLHKGRHASFRSAPQVQSDILVIHFDGIFRYVVVRFDGPMIQYRFAANCA